MCKKLLIWLTTTVLTDLILETYVCVWYVFHVVLQSRNVCLATDECVAILSTQTTTTHWAPFFCGPSSEFRYMCSPNERMTLAPLLLKLALGLIISRLVYAKCLKVIWLLFWKIAFMYTTIEHSWISFTINQMCRTNVRALRRRTIKLWEHQTQPPLAVSTCLLFVFSHWACVPIKEFDEPVNNSNV